MKTFSVTDIGKKRKLNQDFVFSSDIEIGNLPNLFIVADGMGGHNGGGYASRFTVETIVEVVRKSARGNARDTLRHAISTANERLRVRAEEDEALYGMGTTIVAATLNGSKLLVANVGDSRLYVINDTIRQITRDHSLVEEMVRAGGIDEETARHRSDKNIITRAVGAMDEITADFFQLEVRPGDIILMCSDGLTNMLEDEEIRVIVRSGRDIVEKAEKLVEAANSNGGRDNIAVILIEPFADTEEAG
ncbi:MAG: Stp1/IreP family PP2C-type Ser/Thr phosphatase [Lachnospiraceae bacterium]|nr:Stp1/IreP family PP2C-type Ser/Thr phosphatase [Lachnospiraceae bacterium]